MTTAGFNFHVFGTGTKWLRVRDEKRSQPDEVNCLHDQTECDTGGTRLIQADSPNTNITVHYKTGVARNHHFISFAPVSLFTKAVSAVSPGMHTGTESNIAPNSNRSQDTADKRK